MSTPKIVTYRGMCNENQLLVRGHLFADYGLEPHLAGSSWWTNLREFIKRYRLQPLSGRIVEARLNGGAPVSGTTDPRGFFEAELPCRPAAVAGKWGAFEYRLADAEDWKQGEVLLSHPSNVGVISDIDDTVITSHSTLPLRKFYLMVTRNAHSRRPTPELEKLLLAIRHLNEDRLPEDFFYVSDSEWNLYDFLVKFFEIHRLPKGVFLLRRFQRGFWDALRPDAVAGNTKYDRIQFLFRFFPKKPFILVGDTSQRDMAIYASIARDYASRVKGILIRQVRRAAAPEKVERYMATYRELGIPFELIH